jgi:hypothetical protein
MKNVGDFLGIYLRFIGDCIGIVWAFADLEIS